ncbi:MAG: TetR-like C-terminal domain-containing protein, partial [Sphingomonadales bacterium]
TISSQVISFGLENPHRYRLLWRQDLLDDDPRLEAAMDRIYDRLMAVLSDENNSMNVGVESQAIALWSLVHGYVSLRLDESLVAKEDEQSGQPRAEAIINVMIEGIGR